MNEITARAALAAQAVGLLTVLVVAYLAALAATYRLPKLAELAYRAGKLASGLTNLARRAKPGRHMEKVSNPRTACTHNEPGHHIGNARHSGPDHLRPAPAPATPPELSKPWPRQDAPTDQTWSDPSPLHRNAGKLRPLNRVRIRPGDTHYWLEGDNGAAIKHPYPMLPHHRFLAGDWTDLNKIYFADAQLLRFELQ